MTLKEIGRKIEKLFVEPENDLPVQGRMELQYKRFLLFVNSLGMEEFPVYKSENTVKRETVLRNVRQLFQTARESVDRFYRADFAGSIGLLQEEFFDKGSLARNPLQVVLIQDRCFFRIRKNETYRLYGRSEMFHIPFEKRGIISNQRYSISGYPCLYLGRSLYGCWEATGRPNPDTCNLVCLKPTRALLFVDLSIPDIRKKEDLNTYLLYSLVLRLVCSLKVRRPEDHFKPEYIIPQNILNCVVRANRGERKNPYDGIRFTSMTYCEGIFPEKKLFDNYVLPIRENADKGLCPRLAETFTMTEPTSLIHERIRREVGTAVLHSRERQDIYSHTEFGVLEQQLAGRPFYPFHEKTTEKP